ncbi:hypothetical protein J8L85_00250 [Maribacter sp. MMG018]|uniref:hypothetical protein n=1 Tax=Maribacter sp. MMG018 TaxID=2822688 RepID=UPI001B384FDF|nr:hypothetical protein [Maribacter sp. MMG018]MBQ4912845.1 hypothetical protein [Maribacter sp. MMG018]
MHTSINFIFKTIVCLFFITSFVSCNNKKAIQPTTDFIQIEPEKASTNLPSISGEWKLDSIVWTDDSIRGKQQIPFSTTIWSFSAEGDYVVEILQNQYDVSSVEDGTKQKTSLTAETPSQKFIGKFKENSGKVTTTILGGDTEYQIVQQSDTSLHLKSQRVQVPPISEEDKGKIAEHYFSLYKQQETNDQ